MPVGYSGNPQAKKLGLKPGQRLCLDHPPDGWSLTDPPERMILVQLPDAGDVIVSFFRSDGELAARLPVLAEAIFPAGALWVAWPRRAGGHRSDISDNLVREYALPIGLVDVKITSRIA